MEKKRFKPGISTAPATVKYNENGQPDLSEWVDAGPCIVEYDENGNPKHDIDAGPCYIMSKEFKKEMERQMRETSDLTGHDWVINDIDEVESGTEYYENGIPQY